MPDTAMDHAERIATLEVRMEVLTESVRESTRKIDELLTIVQQARGARYVLVGVGVVLGGVITYVSPHAAKIAAAMQAISK